MVWPPRSPDLNIIKSVWDYMKRETQLRLPKSTEELWLVLQDVWANLPADFLQKLSCLTLGLGRIHFLASQAHVRYAPRDGSG